LEFVLTDGADVGERVRRTDTGYFVTSDTVYLLQRRVHQCCTRCLCVCLLCVEYYTFNDCWRLAKCESLSRGRLP